MRVNVVRARHLGGAAAIFSDQAPAYRKGEVDELACEQALFPRRFEFDFQSCLVLTSPSYQYMSGWAMYARNRSNGY